MSTLIIDPVEAALRAAAALHYQPKSDEANLLTSLTVPELRRALGGYRLLADPVAGDVVSSTTVQPIPRVDTDSMLGPDTGGRVIGRLVPIVHVDGEATFAGYESGRVEAATIAPPGTTASLSAAAFDQLEAIHSRFAVGLTAEKRVLQDSGLLRMALDWLLGVDMSRALDAEALNGDASTTERWDGMVHNAEVPTAAKAGGTSHFDTVLAGALAVRQAGWTGPLAVISPAADAFDIVTERDATTGQPFYRPETWAAIGGIPFGSGGLVMTEELTAGTVLVGSFAQAAHAFMRDPVTIRLGPSHSDYFTTGKVAILADARVGFSLLQPSALYKLTSM